MAMSEIDFGKITLLERVSVAARETVYTAAIAWLLGEAPLDIQVRKTIIEELVGRKFGDVVSIQEKTEVDNIDLTLIIRNNTGSNFVVAIENKIKSVEGHGQLAKYDNKIESIRKDIGADTVYKLFLTLGGEEGASGDGWKPISYEKLYRAIKKATSEGRARLDRSVQEVCEAIGRLATLVEASSSSCGLAMRAFKDEDALSENLEKYELDIWQYVKRMKMEKAFQHLWMHHLAGKIYPSGGRWITKFSETHGQAIIDIQIEHASQDDRYMVGIQIQHRSLKVFCSPNPPEKFKDDDEKKRKLDYAKRVLQIISERMALVELGSINISTGQKRGFCSFTLATMPSGRNIGEWVNKSVELIDKGLFSSIEKILSDIAMA